MTTIYPGLDLLEILSLSQTVSLHFGFGSPPSLVIYFDCSNRYGVIWLPADIHELKNKNVTLSRKNLIADVKVGNAKRLGSKEGTRIHLVDERGTSFFRHLRGSRVNVTRVFLRHDYSLEHMQTLQL
jgi:hypothetical protein